MITERFLEKLYGIKEDMIPDEVYEKAKLHLLDYIGVSYGSKGFDNNNEKIFRMINSLSKEGKCKLIDRKEYFTAPFAAFYNAVINHTIELDDTNSEASLHPSSVIISTAIACGQEMKCSGKKLLYAIIMGYEIMIRLGKALNPAVHYARGFHPTATCGVFGSAVTAAILMNLSLPELKKAVGFAGSYASGNCKYQTEASIAKRLQPAIAAQGGIFAAMAAREGLDGPLTIFDEYNGFLQSHSDNVNEKYLFEDLGQKFQLMKTGLKFYPCCRYIHSAVDGIKEIMNKYSLIHSQIKNVTLEVTDAAIPIVVEPSEKKKNPKSLIEAQFSLFLCAALTIVNSNLSYEMFTSDIINNSVVKEQIDKLMIMHNSELDRVYPEYWPTIVTIYTYDKNEYKIRIDSCIGEADKFFVDDIEKKFIDLSTKSISMEKAKEIKEKISSIMSIENVENLLDL